MMKYSGTTARRLTLVVTVILFSACAENRAGGDDQGRVISGRNNGAAWTLEFPGGDYAYTDLIPMSLQLTFEDGTFLPPPEKSELWGDFRIYSSGYSEGRLELLLQPVKTGTSLFTVPGRMHDSTGPSWEFHPVEIQIKSLLEDESAEPAPLIETPERDLPPVLIILLVILISSAAAVLMIMFRRKKKPDTPEPHLKDYLQDIQDRTLSRGELDDVYRNIFRLLLTELAALHPGILPSDSPSEVKKHLEMPSPLNQWALRSLYPMLDAMHSHFFTAPEPLNERFTEDLAVLREWVQFTENLKKEEG